MSEDRPAPTDQLADQVHAAPDAASTDPEQIVVEWSQSVAALPKAKDVLE